MSIFQKMMAIAGRGEDGKAKAISTTNEGVLKTQLTGGSNVDSYKSINQQVWRVGDGQDVDVLDMTGEYIIHSLIFCFDDNTPKKTFYIWIGTPMQALRVPNIHGIWPGSTRKIYPENAKASDLLEVTLYDDEREQYVVGLKRPLHTKGRFVIRYTNESGQEFSGNVFMYYSEVKS